MGYGRKLKLFWYNSLTLQCMKQRNRKLRTGGWCCGVDAAFHTSTDLCPGHSASHQFPANALGEGTLLPSSSVFPSRFWKFCSCLGTSVNSRREQVLLAWEKEEAETLLQNALGILRKEMAWFNKSQTKLCSIRLKEGMLEPMTNVTEMQVKKVPEGNHKQWQKRKWRPQTTETPLPE